MEIIVIIIVVATVLLDRGVLTVLFAQSFQQLLTCFLKYGIIRFCKVPHKIVYTDLSLLSLSLSLS